METNANSLSESLTDGLNEGAVYAHLITYLKQNKYKIINDNSEDEIKKSHHIVAVSKTGRKEVIEVKSNYTERHDGLKKEQEKKTDLKQQAKYWFSEALLSSFVNFGRYSISGKVTLALGVPDTERYQQIIEKVQEYFTANNLNLKVYMVADDGKVKVHNLNENELRSKK